MQYGGTIEGERKLAKKLANKYGKSVTLLVAKEEDVGEQRQNTNDDSTRQHNEEWYALRPNEQGSGIVNFLSSNFDPVAALADESDGQVYKTNPWLVGEHGSRVGGLVLDNVGKFVFYLPVEDPLRRDKKATLSSQKKTATTATISLSASSKKRPRQIHPFEEITQHLSSGPISVLYKLQRKRIKVVIRYVNAIRGTLTGTLIAYDKHMNMILQNVEEIYSQRPIDNNNEKSNLELEIERRQALASDGIVNEKEHYDKKSGTKLSTIPGNWNIKRRQVKQLLVRGDMVVSIYNADQEKKVLKSRYHSRSKEKSKRE